MTEPPHDPSLDAVGSLPDQFEDLVLAALELAEGARDAELQRIATDHPAHRGALGRWLQSAGVDVPWSADDASKEAAEAPTRIGPYRLIRLLGRGHFGAVHLAEQEHPIRRRVALKVLNPGMDTREVLTRFAGEREALNRMDHPGIARLLDAGETEQGRPFFVMEHVPGQPLTRYCRAYDLGLRPRIELFLRVLDAVQHAHQRAVIHRDLSSNNVLVTEVDGEPQPKVIDFGISKSTAAPLTEENFATFRGTLMGTPEFMSPEQASGRPEEVDTRTDIYALGVQLYELLTDALPIPTVVLRSQGIAGMERVIRTHEPVRPSQIARGSAARALEGDLDWIAQKALAKDPDQRYATVGDFAADLRRYLAHEPIAARPPSRWYRLRKFARRNVGPVAAVSTGVLGLLVALVVTLAALEERRRSQATAERARIEAREHADAGYRLLAGLQRLDEARMQEGALWPPFPERIPDLQRWMRTLAEPLLAEVDDIAVKLDELRTRAAGGDLADHPEQHLYLALSRLQRDVEAFAAADGPLASVHQRLQWAETIEQRSIHAHADAWRRAIAALKSSDGIRAGTTYRGLQLQAQMGLVPLGMNPATELWEFLDLASHSAGEPVPERDPQTGQLRIRAGTGIVFVLLPPGSFWMGAHRNEPGMEQNDDLAADDELPPQPVMLEAFLMARTEITQAQWTNLSGGDRPSRHAGSPFLPAESIDWHRATEVLGHWGMALPTEAQWEYACRATTHTPWHFGADAAQAARLAHFGPTTQTVALFPANGFGIFDLHGNVAEWCRDRKADYRAITARRGDGLRDDPGSELRAVRGGACTSPVVASRCSARRDLHPDVRDPFLGVRPVREVIK